MDATAEADVASSRTLRLPRAVPEPATIGICAPSGRVDEPLLNQGVAHMRELGHRVVLCPGAVAFHHHHGTASRFQPYQLNMLRERNALYTIFKNYGDEALATVLPAALLLVVKRATYASGIPHDEFLVDAQQARGAA